MFVRVAARTMYGKAHAHTRTHAYMHMHARYTHAHTLHVTHFARAHKGRETHVMMHTNVDMMDKTCRLFFGYSACWTSGRAQSTAYFTPQAVFKARSPHSPAHTLTPTPALSDGACAYITVSTRTVRGLYDQRDFCLPTAVSGTHAHWLLSGNA